MPGKLSLTVDALSRLPGKDSLVTTKVMHYAGRSLRILVADDSPTDRSVAVALLRRLGQTADIAVNGDEAARIVHGAPYDVVLMDLRMPVLDGLGATRRIIGDEASAAPRIVAMTGGRAASEKECTAAGMCAYLPKPVRLEQLASILQACSDARKA